VKVAFVTARVPYPLNTGGRIRTFHLLMEVTKAHHVTLLTALEGQEDERALATIRANIPCMTVRVVKVPSRTALLGRFLRAIRSPIDPLPYTWAGYRHPRFTANLQSALRWNQYDLVHCDHVQAAYPLLRLETTPRLINAHNVDSLLIRRIAEQEPRRWRQALITWQAHKTLRAEVRTYCSFNRCVAVSEADRSQIEKIAPGLPISIVPNGVDVDWFEPMCGTSDPHLMVFTGAMDWLPNVDSITFFVREVFPLIKKSVPRAKLRVVGRHPSESLIRRLAGDGIRFTGTVEDVRPHLAEARLVVVPLRIGGGTRLKILEAWAMGKAVLSTSIGAEGLPAVNGENIALADTPVTLAECAVALLDNAKAVARLGAAGRRIAEERFAWRRVAEALLRAYEDTVSSAILD
jgi:polysaccharide biosynthesis protein PslH